MAGRPLFEDRRARLLPADRYRVVCPLAAARDWSIDGVAVLDATFAEYPAFHRFIEAIAAVSGVPARRSSIAARRGDGR